MRGLRSLQARLALAVGLSVTVLWLAAASITANRLGHEMEEVFDRELAATAQRILPLALRDLRVRRDRDKEDDDDDDERVSRLRPYDEAVTYVVRDERGRVLLLSQGAEEVNVPPFEGRGFSQTSTHRLYYDTARDGDVIIAVAEPLDHRAEVSRNMLLGLALPLLVVIPMSLAAIAVATRSGFRPVRKLKQALEARGRQDLSPLPDTGLPSELEPVAGAINQLLDRLRGAFEAERSFAANAAHELRTPVAGAIAQAQRIRTETQDAAAAQRATEIETTLKRLMRMSEKLMQLARAEGSRLRLDAPSDLRPVLALIVADFSRPDAGGQQIALSMPPGPVLSDLDPDVFGILCRNLIENALRHGKHGCPIDVRLDEKGTLTLSNDGPVLPPETVEKLMQRFERGTATTEGSGLGLAIVKAITDRAGGHLAITSPVPRKDSGVQVTVLLPENQSDQEQKM
ncbi:HAMP domain-containing sensor histidine kinase [Rhizobium arsenicireducens]|jgi:two-component system OmpR family sensor kinase